MDIPAKLRGHNNIKESRAVTEPVIIKKYANRRLYNTDTSTYVTLEELAQIIRDGREFEVVDAKTGEDLTRGVMTQVLFEEENRGVSLLPVAFMRQLIRFCDNSVQNVLPQYLEMTMDVFAQQQEKVQSQTKQAMGAFSPFNALNQMQQLQRQQMESAQKVMSAWNPFIPQNEKDRHISELSKQVADLNAEIQRLKGQ